MVAAVPLPVGPPRWTERWSGAVGLLTAVPGLMPLFLGAAALLEKVLAAGDVCTARGGLSTASLEHKYTLVSKSKPRFRFPCKGHVSLIFQPKLQTFTLSGLESGRHVERISTNGSLFMRVCTVSCCCQPVISARYMWKPSREGMQNISLNR